MIDLNLPEPPEAERQCVYCGRRIRLRGTLIHWPNADCKAKTVHVSMTGLKLEPFSTWIYLCAWCRGTETREKKRQEWLSKMLRPGLKFTEAPAGLNTEAFLRGDKS